MLHQKISLIKLSLILVLLLEFFYFFLIYFHTENAMTQDLGRHMTLGKIILEKGKIPSVNLFSYTYPEFSFINHHWGSEIIFYLVERFFSVNGLIIGKSLIMLLALITLSIFSIKKYGFAFLPFILFPVIGLMRERTDTRPEIFAYLLFSMTLMILYREREINSKTIWLLPIIGLLWVNLHISFIMLLGLYLFFLLDRYISGKLRSKYLPIGFLVILGMLLNPYGIKGLLYPLEIFNNYGYSIVENQSPFFLEKVMNNPTIFYFKLSIGIVFFPAFILMYKKRVFEALVMIVMWIISFKAIRNFPFLALSIVYPLSIFFGLMRNRLSKMKKIKAQFLYPFYFLLLIFIWCLTVVNIESLIFNRYYRNSYSPLRTGLGKVKGMESAVDYFIANRLKGPIFNNFDIGSYLIYRLYKKEKVFTDGRPEAYPADFFKKIYIPMQEDENIWQENEEKYELKTIIFSHTDGTPWAGKFIGNILKNPGWSLVYFDDYGFILTKKSENRDPLDGKEFQKRGKFLLSEKNQPDEIVRLIRFFDTAGFTDLSQLGWLKLKKIKNEGF